MHIKKSEGGFLNEENLKKKEGRTGVSAFCLQFYLAGDALDNACYLVGVDGDLYSGGESGN